MKKNDLLKNVKRELQDLNGNFEEYIQFTCDELYAIIATLEVNG